MKCFWRWSALGALAISGIAARMAWAETIELVTYYPAPQTPDMHTRSLTVGTPYANELLLDGPAIFYSWVGIGNGFFTAANRAGEHSNPCACG